MILNSVIELVFCLLLLFIIQLKISQALNGGILGCFHLFLGVLWHFFSSSFILRVLLPAIKITEIGAREHQGSPENSFAAALALVT